MRVSRVAVVEGAQGREGSVLEQMAGTGLGMRLISHEMLQCMLRMEGPLALDKPQRVSQLMLRGQGTGVRLP